MSDPKPSRLTVRSVGLPDTSGAGSVPARLNGNYNTHADELADRL